MMALTPEEEERIAAAVTAAEQRTAAEFAVVVAQASDDYAGYPLIWAGAVALVAGGIAALVWPALRVAEMGFVQGACYALTAVALTMLPSRAWLAPSFVRRERAEALAAQQFAARVARRTQDGAGLLLFVSLAEHAAIIRVDHRIAGALPETTWQVVIDDLIRGAQDGRLADAIISAVNSCATTLAAHFPPQTGQSNEIDNQITRL